MDRRRVGTERTRCGDLKQDPSPSKFAAIDYAGETSSVECTSTTSKGAFSAVLPGRPNYRGMGLVHREGKWTGLECQPFSEAARVEEILLISMLIVKCEHIDTVLFQVNKKVIV